VVHPISAAHLFLTDGDTEGARFRRRLLGESSGTLTPGAAIGTPAYMAPEQARGATVDHPRASMRSAR